MGAQLIISDLDQLPTRELLRFHARIGEILRERNVCRSANNPVADYTEYLVARALSLDLARGAMKGYDAQDGQGRRYEIKGRRRPSLKRSARRLSAIRDLPSRHFDFLVGVLYEPDYEVRRACLIPFDVVKEIATYKEHTNSWSVMLYDHVWDIEGVRDITVEVRAVADK